jgi:hypothetical protein
MTGRPGYSKKKGTVPFKTGHMVSLQQWNLLQLLIQITGLKKNPSMTLPVMSNTNGIITIMNKKLIIIR